MSVHPLITTAMLVFAIKLILLVVDPTPLFFMGDSKVYIDAAVYHNIPWSRSFTYGWLIRLFAVWPGTLQPLVVSQVLASALTAWLLALTLLRFFAVRPSVVIVASILFAVDPLQLIHERLILTETFTLLLLAGNLLAAFRYLRYPGLLSLFLVCLTGIFIVSLRLVYIPVVLSEALLLPLLGWVNGSSEEGLPDRRRKCLLHVGAALLISLGLHAGYRQLVGSLTGRPAAYLHWDGLFLISAWAPLLQSEDATDPRTRSVIARQMADPHLPLKERHLRGYQLWMEGGLVDRLRQTFAGDWYATNQSARTISRLTLRRDPFGVARLAWFTYLDHWNPAKLRTRLLVEQGSETPLPAAFVRELAARFGFDAANSHNVKTISKQMHLAGGAWYQFLLVSPLICLLNVALIHSTYRVSVLLVATVSLLLLLTTCAAASETVYRYLHAFSFTGMLALGLLTDAILNRWRVTSLTGS